MGDVLSQNEIDNLLEALISGELDADEISEKSKNQKVVYDYNFAKPAKFSKEHLRTLEIIFEHYGRLLSTHLPIYLRKNVQVDLVNAEAITYHEFSNALSSPVLFGILDLQPLEGNAILSIDSTLGFTMIDRLLGGKGIPLTRTREFSEIELTILGRIFNICVGLLVEPWENVVSLEPQLERIETNPQFAQIYSPNEMTAIVTLNLLVGDVTGMITVCLPYTCLEPVMDKLSTKFWYASTQEKGEATFKDTIELAISSSKIPVRVILGKSIISVNEFSNLQRGDVIKLDHGVDGELDMFVGNIHKFTVVPGALKDSYAVKIKSVIREEHQDG